MSVQSSANTSEIELIEKIRRLPPEKVAEVKDFVDFLLQRIEDNLLLPTATKLSEESFARVWDNEEDAVYDKL